LSSIIESKINVKTYLENDTRAMTYGEYNCGIVKNEQEILFINISWGLGMGIICKGNLYYGKSGYSGEFGHAPLFNNDILCQCGKRGCLETEVSGWALERKIKDKLRSGATPCTNCPQTVFIEFSESRRPVQNFKTGRKSRSGRRLLYCEG